MTSEKKSGKWFAILVIAIFLLSTFSIMLYSNKSSSQDTNTTTVDPTKTLSLNYTANLEGVIKDYPVKGFFILQGVTLDSSTDVLDSKLKDINNVYTVTSSIQLLDSNSLTNLDSNEIKYIYTAQVLGTDLDYSLFNSSIKDKNIFSEYLVYPSAVVDYNSFVVFKNSDLNTTKEYDLGSNEITVLMHPEKFDNQIGDKISFGIYAKFNGDVLANYMSEQNNNISTSPLTISSLYSRDYNKLGYSVLILNADKNFEENDFNFIKSLNYDFNYYGQENNARLNFGLNTDFGKLISDVNKKLSIDFNANVNYAIDVSLFVDKINYMDKNYDINSNVTVYSDFSGKSYPGLNYLKYSNSKKLQYNISAYLIRDKVVNANAEVMQDLNN